MSVVSQGSPIAIVDVVATHLLEMQDRALLAWLHFGFAQMLVGRVTVAAQVALSAAPAWQVPALPLPTQ